MRAVLRFRFTALVASAGLLVGCAGDRYPDPPPTRVALVTDTFHGVAFNDPYRWLEDQEAPETREWLAAQDAYAESIVGQGGLRAEFTARLTELMDLPDIGSPRRAGEDEIFSLRRVGEPVAKIYRRPAPVEGDDEPIDPEQDYEIVLDPLELRSDGTTAIGVIDISSDGRRLIFAIRDGGPDEREYRVLDLETGDELPDRLPAGLYGSVFFSPDNAGFYYSARSRVTGARVRYHEIGTPMSDDPVLFGERYGPTAFVSASLIDDDRKMLYGVQHGWARSEVWVGDLEVGTPATPIVRGEDARFYARWSDGRLYMRTNLGASNSQLVSVDLDRPDRASWQVVLPEGEDVLEDFAFIDGRIYATYLRDVSTRIAVFEMDGTPVGEVDVPEYHSAGISGAGAGKARLTVRGHLTPTTVYELDLATGERTVTEAPEEPFDGSGMEVRQVWRTSKDGTEAPMYVVHKAGIDLDGTNPTLLYGYGGFYSAQRPGFSALGAAWIEQGGVYAVATLRGGSEYGEDWHRDGMLESKQHVFDDFISAGEWLVDNDYTSPEHLAIRGVSNGGLLVTASLTQRPDLFRAVFVGLPDIDMLRFWTFTATNNMPALLEYGDASDVLQFEFIRHYSPYQAVRDGTPYPAVMFFTGDLDTRVPPLQARKMAARLQAATSSGLPVILSHDARAGHAGGRTLQTRVEEIAMELTFLMSMVRPEAGGSGGG